VERGGQGGGGREREYVCACVSACAHELRVCTCERVRVTPGTFSSTTTSNSKHWNTNMIRKSTNGTQRAL